MPSWRGLSTTALHLHRQLLSISFHPLPQPFSTPLVSPLSSHASAISLPHSANPHPPPLAGGSATICRNWFISPNFPRERGVPIWCPRAWASESQVAERCVKPHHGFCRQSAPRSAPRATCSRAPLTPLCLRNKLCSRNLLSMASLR